MLSRRQFSWQFGQLSAEANRQGIIDLVEGTSDFLDHPGLLKPSRVQDEGSRAAEVHLDLLASELAAYADGDLRVFSVPVDLAGAGVHEEFARAVYSEICRIPFGETASYGEIARLAGRPRAARQVGRLCREVPVVLLIPVHRVVRADGGLSGHSAARKMLIDHEHRTQLASTTGTGRMES